MLKNPRAKPGGWAPGDAEFTPAQATLMDVNISLIDATLGRKAQLGAITWWPSRKLAPTPAFAGVPQIVPLLPKRSFSAGTGQFRIPILMGDSSTSTQLLRTGDGSTYTAGGLITPAWSVFKEACAGGPGEIFLTQNSSGQYTYSTDHGATWTTFTFVMAGISDIGYAYVNGQHCYLFSDTSSGLFFKHTLGGSQVGTALPGAVDKLSFNGEFANNERDTIAYCVPVNGNAFSSIFYSVDSGHTWRLGRELNGIGNLTWSRHWKRFVVWEEDGTISTSVDAVKWKSTRFQASAVNTGMQVIGKRAFAAAGPYIAKLWLNLIDPPNHYQHGVALSPDLGSSWNFFPIEDNLNFPAGLYGFNDRFYVTGSDAVWQSSPLSSPAHEL